MSSRDVGYLDDTGRLFVVGRDEEMIGSGGENVYPVEAEKDFGRTRGRPGAARESAGRPSERLTCVMRSHR